MVGKDTNGLNIDDNIDLTPSGAGPEPALTVNVRIGTGDLEVTP